jgi:tetratricopeptide (TPR) repeat protein
MGWRHPALGMIGALLLAGAAGAQAPAPMAMSMPGMDHGPAGPPETLADWAKGAQLFDGLGPYHRAITTGSPEAQGYFDQGLKLLYGFNHDEAARSFAKGYALDPHCAMCLWGVALTLGPNYNMPMMAQVRARVGFDAIRRAEAEAPRASAVEQALIAALSRRFSGPAALEGSNLASPLVAYAAAMKAVAARFPGDADVQTLYAEAMMNLNPWKLWKADGSPAPGTADAVATLEAVLAAHPDHPGANHYYIHAVEASTHPEKALASAERLKTMMPAAGHIVHMPSHIFQRVGRYEDSAEANRRGAEADAAYYKQTNPIDYYPMYTAHNYQFLAFSAAMEGRRAETMAAVRAARVAISDDMLAGMPGVDWSVAYLYDAMVRFGLWDEILAEPAPNAKLSGLTVGYLSARAIALTARGRVAEARAVAAELDKAVAATPAGALAGMNGARDVYRVAALKAHARIAMAAGDVAGGIATLREAVALEDRLTYNEPADTFFPTRHLLGAALLADGKAAEAEAVYREDLARNPENGWALHGLAAALTAGRNDTDAAAARTRFAAAWSRADIPLAASAF